MGGHAQSSQAFAPVADPEEAVRQYRSAADRAAGKKAAAANPATCHRAISGKSSPLEAPASSAGELRCETFSAKVKALRRACCQGAARWLKLRTRCART